jgi:four helix bundle protein
MHNHHELDVWHRSMGIAEMIYSITASFPKGERYGLVSQMRRAAVSIPSNIAEGLSRKTDRDIRRFLSIARGSASELETQLLLAQRFELVSLHQAKPLVGEIDEVRAMLVGLARNLAQHPESPPVKHR